MAKKLLIIVSIILYTTLAKAETLTFEWDANHENDHVIAYHLYYSETSGTYGLSFDSETDVSTETGVITLSSTAPDESTQVVLHNESEVLPTGFSKGTIYYVRGNVGSTCKISTTDSDDDIVIPTAVGSGTAYLAEDFEVIDSDTAETKTSRRSATYKWTASTGTGVYFCELSGGGDPSISEPDRVWNDSDILTEGFSTGDTEHLSETDFATHANWDVTNDFDDSGGDAEYTWSANQTSTLTQESVDFANALIANTDYTLSYTVSVTTAPDGDLAMTLTTGIADVAEDLAITEGSHSYTITTNGSPGNFVIQIVSGTDTEGQFSIDDVSLKKIDALSENYWDYGDVDSHGWDTIYIRVTDDVDPDTLDVDAIQSSILIDPVEYTTTYDFPFGQWYFVVTAIDEDNCESDYSNEVDHVLYSSIALTGTLFSNNSESDVVDGDGFTVIATILNDDIVDTAGDDNAISTAIIQGLAGSAAWNTCMDSQDFNDLTCTTKVCTLVIDDCGAYAIEDNDILTWTFPDTAILLGEVGIEAAPTIEITAESEQALPIAVSNINAGGLTISNVGSGGLTVSAEYE